MTGDSSLPTGVEPLLKGRSRLRAEWRAESTWRRHEISGRLKELERNIRQHENELDFRALLAKIDEALVIAKAPVKLTKSLTAEASIERELPEKTEEKKDDGGEP